MSGVRCQVSGVRCQVSGVIGQRTGIRYSVFGVRCSVFGVRCSVFGMGIPVWLPYSGARGWIGQPPRPLGTPPRQGGVLIGQRTNTNQKFKYIICYDKSE